MIFSPQDLTYISQNTLSKYDNIYRFWGLGLRLMFYEKGTWYSLDLQWTPKVSHVWKVVGSWGTVLTSRFSIDEFSTWNVLSGGMACMPVGHCRNELEDCVLVPCFSLSSLFPGYHETSATESSSRSLHHALSVFKPTNCRLNSLKHTSQNKPLFK